MKEFKPSIIPILICFISFSCQNDLPERPLIDERFDISLQEATEWFETNFNNVSRNGQITAVMTPRWDKAMVFKNSIELPFTTNGKLQLPHSEYGLKHQGRTRILLHKNIMGINAYIVRYIPSNKFNGNIREVNVKNFKSLYFDGRITVTPLKNEFVMQEFILQNGEIMNGFDNKVNRVKEWYQQCTDWFQWNGNEWSYLDTTCNTWWESGGYYDYAQYFSYDSSWPWYTGGSGSGSGNSYYVNDPYWLHCIENQLTTPCLKNTANKVLDPNLASTYNSLIQDIFNSNDKVNLILTQGSLSTYNAIAGTIYAPAQNGILNVNIKIDPSGFEGSSEEWIAAVIYHECFHAIVEYLENGDVSQDDQHIAMYSNYLNLLASGLQAAYPNMDLIEAKDLILKGLLNLDGGADPPPGYWSTSFVDKVLASSGRSSSQVFNTYYTYQIWKTKGTPCN